MNISKTTIFRIINEVELEDDLITCQQCQNLLTHPIFVLDDQLYCQHCAHESTPRNRILERVFKSMKYPCKFAECEFLGKQEDTLRHEEDCYFKSFVCSFCKKVINEATAISHLRKDHEDMLHEVVLDEPQTVLTLPTFGTKIFVLTLNTLHTFVTICNYFESDFQLFVGKSEDAGNATVDKFHIEVKIDHVELSMKAIVSNMRQLLAGSWGTSQIIRLPADSANHKFTISFNDFNLVKDVMETCPVCLDPLSPDLYKCPSNHATCKDCRPENKVCPLCRTDMKEKLIQLRFGIPKIPYSCPNSADGCIHYIRNDELDKHLSECLFAAVQCDCKEFVSKYKFIAHLQSHSGVIKNCSCVQFLCDDIVFYRGQAFIAYIIYDSKVFKFTLLEGESPAGRLNLNVQVLNCKMGHRAEQYKYVAQILAHSTDLLPSFRIENACQACTDHVPNSSISFDLFKSYVVDGIITIRLFVY